MFFDFINNLKPRTHLRHFRIAAEDSREIYDASY